MPRVVEQENKVKLVKNNRKKVSKDSNQSKFQNPTNSLISLIKKDLETVVGISPPEVSFTDSEEANTMSDTVQTGDKDFTIKFEGEKIKEYQDPIKLSKEIKRCKPNAKIANAYVSRFNYSLTIVAENESTYNELQKPWKQDAFGSGIKKKEIKRLKYFIAIKGVHPTINVEDSDFINELNKANVLNPKRIVKKSTNVALPLIKAEVSNLETFNNLINTGRIKIGYTVYHCSKWEFNNKPLQCFKCNGFGHSSASCPNSNRCLICAEDHDYKNCPNKSKQDQSILKCVNCSGNHSACS